MSSKSSKSGRKEVPALSAETLAALEQLRDEILKEFRTVFKQLEAKLDRINDRVDEHAEHLSRIDSTSEDLESRVRYLETLCSRLEEKCNKLLSKMVDLENRSRRCSLRILGLPEATEQGSTVKFFAEFLCEIFGKDLLPNLPELERARRVYVPPGILGSRPRPVILCFHQYQWDLVCNNNWRVPFATSVFYMGVLVGSFTSGILSDRFGRKIVMFGTMAVQIIFNFLLAFSPNLEIFSLINFFRGLGDISNYVAAFVLGSELLTDSMRITYSTFGVGVFFALGYMFLPFVAYFIREWRTLTVTLTLCCLFYIPLWWFIPESPRWLLSKGKVEEAESVIRHIAKKNGVTPPPKIFSELELEYIKNNEVKSVPFTQLLKTCNIRAITIINVLVWMIISMGYFALTLNIPNLHGDDYLNCFLFAASEIPANVATWLLLRKYSRKFSLSGALFLGGSVLLFIQLIPSHLSIVATVLVLIGRFGTSCAFFMVYIYTAELYPTPLRNTGVGVSSMASRISSIFSPYILLLVRSLSRKKGFLVFKIL
ncbi:organic cation/carnitine transporter 2-like isoform X3 [Hemitrygon akajei]|uniref:organic cation/carnitine transporter 2-like isoform X3 n=1 Tax=Hemitrygon akajei TaxID=2704970 RepID=UPI003BF976D5